MSEERKKAELKISGMTCAMCATTIEKSILSQDGVAGAQVNLGNVTATVEYDATKVKLTDLEKAGLRYFMWVDVVKWLPKTLYQLLCCS
jgi:Cu+-exporting ATPase